MAPPSFFEEWMEIINDTFSFNFSHQPDKISWKWGGNKIFTTKSTYNHLAYQPRAHFGHIWKAKIQYKIKIFTWLLEKNAILTKDNLIRRKWQGAPFCAVTSRKFTQINYSLKIIFKILSSSSSNLVRRFVALTPNPISVPTPKLIIA